MNFFNNICLLPEETLEKRLARCQIAVKTSKSASWFTEIKKLLWFYDLPDTNSLLECPVPRISWKRQIFTKISDYWSNQIIGTAKLYSTLKYLNSDIYIPGKIHPLLSLHTDSTRDASRGRLKLKLVSGSYTLQANRAAFNQNEVKPTCLLCNEENETLSHFLLSCKSLETVRQSIMGDICHVLTELTRIDFNDLSIENQTRILLDCSYLFDKHKGRTRIEFISMIEFQCNLLFIVQIRI